MGGAQFGAGGDALGTKAVRSVSLLLAPFALLLAGSANLTADEFKTPAISAVHVEWRAALDQLRSEINTQPAVASAFTFTGQLRLVGWVLNDDISDAEGGKGEAVKALSAQFPDLRRFIREGYVRYAFTRFGVPYVVSIQCLDSAPGERRLACREAYPVAERFLKALRVAGGLPSRPRMDLPPLVAERPADRSPDFTYRPSADIIANSAFRKQRGHPDFTPYSPIRFPLHKAPGFVHWQEFN